MNKKIILGIAVITIFGITTLIGCNTKKPILSTKEVSTNLGEKPVMDTEKGTIAEPLTQLKYIITTIPSNTKIELNTPWESSPLGGSKATLEGKGDKTQEEGYSHIIIENKKSGKLTKLTLENEESIQLTARDLEWMDEDNLFVIIGYPFGTVSRGGKIYKVNIITGETTLFANTVNSKEEFTAVHKLSKGFTFEKYVYEDDNFTKGHIESGNLELQLK